VLIENTWIFPALEATHVIGLALMIGPIVLSASPEPDSG
jgi:hypothetical protein